MMQEHILTQHCSCVTSYVQGPSMQIHVQPYRVHD